MTGLLAPQHRQPEIQPYCWLQTKCSQGYWWTSSSSDEGKLIIAARLAWSTECTFQTLCLPIQHHLYLQFIVDYYDCLPQHMAFIHAHRRDMKVAPDYAMVRSPVHSISIHSLTLLDCQNNTYSTVQKNTHYCLQSPYCHCQTVSAMNLPAALNCQSTMYNLHPYCMLLL